MPYPQAELAADRTQPIPALSPDNAMPKKYSNQVLIKKEKSRRCKMKQDRKKLNGCVPWLVVAFLGYGVLNQSEPTNHFLQWLLSIWTEWIPIALLLFSWLLPAKARQWILKILSLDKSSET